ncbi:hypothetical protein Daus18300_008431 [Diaporthe australafricana]|uniref:Uncharacterized protein n=1 Tax=Diaporthe australafricana TaxID=127596 RepID=A0ABR3WIK4_9PEZI
MRLFNVFSVVAALASFVAAIPAGNFENGIEHSVIKRVAGASSILSPAELAKSKKVCKTIKKRAEDELSEVLFKRTGSGTDSELDSDGEKIVEDSKKLTTLYMKGVGTVPKTKALSVAGVNGCTAVFFFNAAETSRTGGHCTGGDEAKIAIKAARAARTAGNTGKAVIRAPDETTVSSVKQAILTVFTPTSWDTKTYPFEKSSQPDNDCFAFTYKEKSNSLEESWQRLEASV